jgi:hypothetical protein
VELKKPGQDFPIIRDYFNWRHGLMHWARNSVLLRCLLDAGMYALSLKIAQLTHRVV